MEVVLINTMLFGIVLILYAIFCRLGELISLLKREHDAQLERDES